MIEILDQYQDLAARTASDKTDITVVALGLAGEAGEFADHIKKHIAQGHDLDQGLLILELGDILWYVANAARVLNVPLSLVANGNIAKLKLRYGDAFTTEASIHRGHQ